MSDDRRGLTRNDVPALKRIWGRIDGEGVTYARWGYWSMALGGYDTGYIVSYLDREVMRVNYELKEVETFDDEVDEEIIDEIKQILECSQFEDVTGA